ncbi:HGGxSTG domain-containing protein [Robbsia andropogonis]|uniref:HGGxSTG domain-containing protein n=1 Tax=Robbsia andropogonis TaxID=28092 RepID=UPI0004656941|nr:HGGxSTG domain-containing protein [Robbsia andropogonis]
MTDDKRKRLKAHNAEFERARAHREAVQCEHDRQVSEWLPWRGPYPTVRLPPYPPFPDDLRGLQCGAKTRAGTPCKRIDVAANGRCKLHGGRSTGPQTEEGKKRVAANGLKPKRKQTP